MKAIIFLNQSVINLGVDFFEFSKDGFGGCGVNENRFLDEHEKAHLDDYDRHVLAQQVGNYFHHLDFGQLHPYWVGDSDDSKISLVQELLKQPESVHHIIDLVALSEPSNEKNQNAKIERLFYNKEGRKRREVHGGNYQVIEAGG